MLIRKKFGELPPVVEAKWSPEVVNEGYAPFPKRLIRCMHKIFEGEKAIDDLRVVLAIIDYRRPNLSRPPSYEFLAFTAGMDEESFKSRVSVLQKRGWITVEGPDEAVSIEIEGLMAKIVELTQSTDDDGKEEG